MAIFLIMGKFTQQGNKNLKQTTTRSEKFREIAGKFGDQGGVSRRGSIRRGAVEGAGEASVAR